MPGVSVIMPCFNHAQFVEDSIRSILQQTYQDLELIVVDDCSSDASWEIISRLAAQDSRIKPIHHEQNRGISQSRNDALQAAGGQFIAFCDSDDIWEPEKLQVQVKLLQDNPKYDVLYCDTIIIQEDGLSTGEQFSDRFPVPKIASGWLFLELVKRNFINIQSVIMRRECAKSAGGFDTNVRWVEDWWYWIKISRQHRFLYSSRLLAKYRVHSRSTGIVRRRSYNINRYKVFQKILQEFNNLPPGVRAGVIYSMGVALCCLGKNRPSQRMFCDALTLASREIRSLGIFCKAFIRIVMHNWFKLGWAV